MNRILALTFILIPLHGCFHANEESGTNATQSVTPLYTLNDTGANSFLEETVNEDNSSSYAFSSTASILINQDAASGRDVAEDADDDGALGFSFVKLDETGTALTDQATSYTQAPWSCVYDNTTGLTWEVKTNSGLQNSIHRFTWYNSDTLSNGGYAGDLGDTSSCGGELSQCNTEAYIAAINGQNNVGLCNYTDWRLPTREELRSLIHYGKEQGTPMIDTNYFPFTAATDHWTSQTAIYASTSGEMAWEVHFEGGYSEAHNKQSSHVAVRLVRGPQ